MQEGLWLHNMYFMDTNLWTFGAAIGYNESSGQNQQWTKKRTIIAKCYFILHLVIGLDCKVDVSKIYASHLNLWEHINQTHWTKWKKKITHESFMKLLAKQEWAWVTSNHSKPFKFFLFVFQLWSKLLVARIKNTHETKETYSKGIQEHTKLWSISKFEIEGSRVKIHREKYLSHMYYTT